MGDHAPVTLPSPTRSPHSPIYLITVDDPIISYGDP